MTKSITLRAALAAVLCLAANTSAQAGNNNSVACSVSVDYLLNRAVVESYRKDFSVSPGQAFSDDFSTAIRQKQFSASAARDGGNTVVSIDYFNDVGVFVSVGFNTQLSMGRNIESTSGSHSLSTSLGVVGTHSTNYTLTCRR